MRIHHHLTLYFFLLSLCKDLGAQPVIPFPSETKGRIDFMWDSVQQIYSSDKIMQDNIAVFNSMLKHLGFSPLTNHKAAQQVILLKLDKSMDPEAYRMDVLPNHSLQISGQPAGVFYGLMSVLQMRHSPEQGAFTLIDKPAFPWRGMHLDVSRHFFPIEFIKKYIDLLALHKFNTFHWHLTDDQGWRIEIKKYPLLTKIGSRRHETMVDKHFAPYIGDGKPVEGFYTQEEVKEVVKYATQRHITIVPEIEMPGHAQAALAAYPQYSCFRSPLDVLTKWGVSEDVFCTKDSTLTFLKNILDEVMKLFPSKFIHIGGDEVPKTRWKKCTQCQENIRKHKLADEHELQSYFIRQIDAYVSGKGRNIIGWDEILEGGLAPKAAVMSWRGEEGGIEAARQRHSVVMTPGSHCYFDHYQGNRRSEPLAIGGFTPIEKVYAYQPVPEQLNPTEAAFIMGAQANVWTEYMGSPEHVEYMVLPRICALSEVLWTGKMRPGFASFKERLKPHFRFLDRAGAHYSRSIFDVNAQQQGANGLLKVTMQTAYPEGQIRYTLDGDPPNSGSIPYTPGDSLALTESSTLRAQYFENGTPMGHELVQSYIVHRALGKNISSDSAPSPYYNKGGLPKLLDGVAGLSPRINDEWLGWSGEDVCILIDLGEEHLLNGVTLWTLKEEKDWIYLPRQLSVEVGLSQDQFLQARVIGSDEIASAYKEGQALDLRFNNMILGRYVRVRLGCAPKIPEGQPGAGESAWLFLSEIAVD